jgi:hypothetical protein
MTTAAQLCPTLTLKSWLSNGTPNAYGTITSYAAGTVTPIATWTDWTATVPNANPQQLNARGEMNCYLLPNVAYKLVEADSFGNQIKSTDQVLNSTLLSLFGGVDTGTANAYQLSFTAPYSTLSNGIIIYFLPANTNTGNSTLQVTVNGSPLGGVVPILNQNGSQLGSGQIVAGGVTAVFYYNGNWLLTSSTGSVQISGSFLGTLSGGVGGSTNPGTCTYAITGNIASLYLPFMNVLVGGTGQVTMSGLPTALQPATHVQTFPIPLCNNNGAIISTCLGQVNPGSNVISFSASAPPIQGGSGFTSSASIGLHVGIANIGQSVIYGLN